MGKVNYVLDLGGGYFGRVGDQNVLALWTKEDGSEETIFVPPHAFEEGMRVEDDTVLLFLQENMKETYKEPEASTSGHNNDVQIMNEYMLNETDEEEGEEHFEEDRDKPSNIINEGTEGTNSIKWTKAMTFLFIKIYSDVDKKQNNWTKIKQFKCISRMMQEEKYTVTHDQCNNKWKLLASRYKKNLLKKSKTGGRPVTWPFFDAMHEIYHNRPEAEPPAVASSLNGYKQNLTREINERSHKIETKKNEMKKSKQELLLEELTAARNEAQSRHAETSQQRNDFISIFRDAVDVLKKRT